MTIGDFARIGGVSARMLRHYDQLGLLRPERVDAASGYRYYAAAQLTRLNHLVALKDLGFTLDEVGDLLDADPAETRDRLARRRADLAAALEADRRRLASVDARLGMLDEDAPGLRFAFVTKPLPRLLLDQLTGTVEDAAEFGERVGPLFAELGRTLAGHGLPVSNPSYAWYVADGDLMRFAVAQPASGAHPPAGLDRGELAAEDRALCVVLHGPIEQIGAAWQALARQVDERGLTLAGPGREVYLETPAQDPAGWVTEVQLPVH